MTMARVFSSCRFQLPGAAIKMITINPPVHHDLTPLPLTAAIISRNKGSAVVKNSTYHVKIL
jgi:hypothetical protein